MSFASQVFVRIEIKHFPPIEFVRLPAVSIAGIAVWESESCNAGGLESWRRFLSFRAGRLPYHGPLSAPTSQSSPSNAYTRAVSIWAQVQQSCSLQHH